MNIFNFWPSSSKGSITIVVLLGVVILGAIYLVRGVTPNLEHVDIGEQGRVVVPDLENTEGDTSDSASLRLRTIKFKACDAQAAVSMQLDITGSMASALNDLKGAVYSFTDQLSDDSVIGIQAYKQNAPRLEVIPISRYSDVKDQIRPAVGSLTAGGGTPTHAALNYSREVLERALVEFPDKNFTYIFFSDGNPNIGPSDQASIVEAAQGIKDLGVTVYAIGLGNVRRNIIEGIASDPSKAITTTNSQELEKIYSEISTEICESTS